MRDIRDPIDVYKAILYQKTSYNCSILEAADRAEEERRFVMESSSLTNAVTTEALGAALGSPPDPAREKGVQ